MSYETLLNRLDGLRPIRPKDGQTQAHQAACPACGSSAGLKIACRADGFILINAMCCGVAGTEIIADVGLRPCDVFQQSDRPAPAATAELFDAARQANDLENLALITAVRLAGHDDGARAALDLVQAAKDVRFFSQRIKRAAGAVLPDTWPGVRTRSERLADTALTAAVDLHFYIGDAEGALQIAGEAHELVKTFKAAGRRLVRGQK